MADRIGKKQSTISSWEKGQTEPSISDMVLIANKFNLVLGQLLDTDLEMAFENKVDQGVERILQTVSEKKTSPLTLEDAIPEFNKIYIETLENNKILLQLAERINNIELNLKRVRK
jgi:transcriptional regulator with XRE-family HTH domain